MRKEEEVVVGVAVQSTDIRLVLIAHLRMSSAESVSLKCVSGSSVNR